MNKIFNTLEFIKQMIKFSPRQGENEQKAAEFIVSVLKKYKIPLALQNFKTSIPLIKKSWLTADGQTLNCAGASFISGRIEGKENIVSSLVISDECARLPNINFSPKSEFVSRPSFYYAPAIAVDRRGLKKILQADKISGDVKVKPFAFDSSNILAGNAADPKIIIFAHYDSIETGATDNASGTAVMMDTIIKYPETLKFVLYVFAGNEELSYDKPTYWGRGYRAFEKKNRKIMERCKNIIVVDSLGNGKTRVDQNPELMHLAFPIINMNEWKNKITLICGDMEKLMKVYHSQKDDLRQISAKCLEESSQILIMQIHERSV